MIMLGGLEENTIDHSGSGLPGLSRIPVLRWLFGSRTKKKTENKLTIFIKPTIIYS
jgi:type IV pilus assembly protein PilQ